MRPSTGHADLRWLAAPLLGIGLATLIVAPMAQSCVTSVDGRACETVGTIVLNVVGGALIGAGLLAVLVWTVRRRRRS